MTDRRVNETTRRAFLRRLLLGGATLAAVPVLQACSGAGSTPAPAAPAKPAESKPAETKPAAPAAQPAATQAPAAQAPAQKAAADSGVDMEAAKREGKLVWYTPTPDEDIPRVLALFTAKYPWVDTSEYLRLQTGKLYAKIEPEMQQNVQSADVLTLSEIALSIDFQKKGFWMSYQSPETAKFDAKWKSTPEGFWISPQLNLAGIGWNPKNVTADEAPKTWEDVLNPKWKGQINVKDSASGLQYASYVMITEKYGEGYWEKFAAQQPIAMAGTAQQFEKIINGENKINALCQQSTFTLNKAKGAPVEMVFPQDGVPQISLQFGIVKNAPHPNVAKLFIDWLLSEEGGNQVFPDTLGDPFTRPGAKSPQFVPPMAELNIWTPKDMDKYIDGQPAWRETWNKLTGM